MFSPFPIRTSRSQVFQVHFIAECSQIPNLAAGQLQVLQHKPSRQVQLYAVVFVSISRKLGFGLWHKCFVTIESLQLFSFYRLTPHHSPGCHTLLYYYYWSILYSAILCSQPDLLHSCHMWFWMSDCIVFLVFFLAHFSIPSDSTISLLHGWGHVKLLLSQCQFCVHHTIKHQFTMSLNSRIHT